MAPTWRDHLPSPRRRQPPARRSSQSRREADGFDTYLHLDDLFATAQRDAFDRRHIAVVAAPPERDVAVGWTDVIGGIEIQPTAARNEHRYPGVRCVRALICGAA